jgi:hypothetical protein
MHLPEEQKADTLDTPDLVQLTRCHFWCIGVASKMCVCLYLWCKLSVVFN